MNSFPELNIRRADFPILRRQLDAGPLIYLDSAATALKPQQVIDAVTDYYTKCTSNVRRSVHALSEEASERFESARDRIARFINADAQEIVFVRSATEGLNLVAAAYRNERPVLVSSAEHHSNLLPWRSGNLTLMPVDGHGRVDLDGVASLVRQRRPELLAFSSTGNALGIRQPVRELVALARSADARVLVDISQSVGHEPLDVREMDCDFACFSGHKMMGPTGVGILYVRQGVESMLSPLLLGGSMVKTVSDDGHVPLAFPFCLEAGTPNVEGVFGLSAACDYIEDVGLETIRSHGSALAMELKREIASIGRLVLHTPAGEDTPIVTFSMRGVQAHAVARLLSNRSGIMARSGYHCAQPVHERLGLSETVRVSFHLYNTFDEVKACASALRTIAQLP